MQNGIIEFMGSKLLTACDELSGIVYVAMKPLIIGMGLNWDTQNEKLKNDSRFNYTLMGMVGIDNKNREMGVLAVDHLPAFLYSINPNKVRKDLRDTIIAFQNETFGVINDYWNKKSKTNNRNVINGYKSQIVQHNKKIDFLEDQVATLQKMHETNIDKSKTLLSEIEEPINYEAPQRVMELIDKGLKYDELNEKYKALDTQYSMFKIMGNEALNKIKYMQEQMSGAIPYLDNVLNNGMERDNRLGWKPVEG